MVFSLFKKEKTETSSFWSLHFVESGLILLRSTTGVQLTNELLPAYIAQLVDDGLATQELNDEITISWDSVYEASQKPGYSNLMDALKLPPLTKCQPKLQSRNSLTDPDFSIALAGWHTNWHATAHPSIKGAVLAWGEKTELMQPDHWHLFKEVVAFARRTHEQRNDKTHRQSWGKIRGLAIKANARLDDFLHRSVVLTPDRLHIKLRKSAAVTDDQVIEIEPSFVGAPANWLERFDNTRDILDRYDIVTPEGIVQVLITPQVKTVLQEIKRLPFRRVAGARAQAFILNPYAALGQDAQDVINEQQFEKAREDAGLLYERFVPNIERDSMGYPQRIGLQIESANSVGPISSEVEWLTDDDLLHFTEKLELSLSKSFSLLGWRGYDLELDGNASNYLSELQSALEQRKKPAVMVSYAMVHDLSRYSARIQGIGVENPYYSPYIAKKKDDEGWFPENVIPIIAYTPDGDKEPIAVPSTTDALDGLRKALEKAEVTNQETLEIPWLPKPIPTQEAKRILKVFDEVLSDVERKVFSPTPENTASSRKTAKTLLLGANIESINYEEQRREVLLATPDKPEEPTTLNTAFPLLPHQREGLAWLQHRYKLQAEYKVRGAVLADDMGLGKTFQLLAFMAWIVEKNPDVDPMLIVAPVSLLENWKEEADKFIHFNHLPILTAYGDTLASLRVPREAIDSRLRNEDRLVRFLNPDWVGNAKVVLTTYETLRDLEFSFAAERWSVMVCDEAQRIKNPAAMITRAAKKQNAGFKIACTGTPVENTLADLWCLFDFIQPGLLGALNDFGKRYRKPIEAKNDEEHARVEELRARISPQILRRTKTEVAKDLPKKIIVESKPPANPS